MQFIERALAPSPGPAPATTASPTPPQEGTAS